MLSEDGWELKLFQISSNSGSNKHQDHRGKKLTH
jgi:hypothetical protein